MAGGMYYMSFVGDLIFGGIIWTQVASPSVMRGRKLRNLAAGSSNLSWNNCCKSVQPRDQK